MHIVLDHLLKNLLLYKKKWLLQIQLSRRKISALLLAELLLGATTLTKSKWHLDLWKTWQSTSGKCESVPQSDKGVDLIISDLFLKYIFLLLLPKSLISFSWKLFCILPPSQSLAESALPPWPSQGRVNWVEWLLLHSFHRARQLAPALETESSFQGKIQTNQKYGLASSTAQKKAHNWRLRAQNRSQGSCPHSRHTPPAWCGGSKEAASSPGKFHGVKGLQWIQSAKNSGRRVKG